MKPLYTQQQFDNAKSREKLPFECEQCHETFYIEKHNINRRGKKWDGRKYDNINRFCNLKCHSEFFHTPLIMKCDQCGNTSRKRPNDTRRVKHNFCCKSCSATYHNAHKTTGTRISKMERWLQQQLPILFPDLEFHFNRKDAIVSELDIYIPSLKLAFELNGIFHYEPIYGSKKLESIENNDKRKLQACFEKNIEVCIIDISSVSYFKPVKAQKFLDIIVNIIKSKLGGGDMT